MPRLLVVHHTPSPALHSLLTAVLDGVADPALADVEVVTRPALVASAADVLEADGVVVGGPVKPPCGSVCTWLLKMVIMRASISTRSVPAADFRTIAAPTTFTSASEMTRIGFLLPTSKRSVRKTIC